MRTLVKLYIMILVVSGTALYLSSCSTAEQTTGKIAYSQGDYEKAEREFDKETIQNPSNEEAWFYLAISRFQLNKLQKAEIALKEYRKLGKGSFDSELIKIWGDQYDKGFSAFDKAKGNADTGISMPQYRQAIDYFKAALILMPDSVVVQKNIDVINNRIVTIKVKPLIDQGADYIKDNKFEDAVNTLKTAMNAGIEKDNPVYDVLNYDMGLAYLKWGENIREEMQATNPDDKSYKKKYEEALPYLENLTATNDQQMKLQAYDLLVQVYGNLNMTEKALEAIKIRDELKSKSDENK